MIIQQLSVFLENRAGQLSEATDLLAKNDIDMQALNIAETSDYGVLRLVVDDPARTGAILKENGYIVRQTPVVHTPVPNQPGGLNTILRTVAKEGIDIEYMYSILGQRNGLAYMVFRVAEPEKLDAVLSKLG